MTHDDWITGLVTLVAALAGGLGGSLIILWTTKWANRSAKEIADEDRAERAKLASMERTERTAAAEEDRRIQRGLAAEERMAQAEFAAQQRELDAQQQRDLRAKSVVAELMVRVEDLRSHIPGLLVTAQVFRPSDASIKARDAYRRLTAARGRLVTDKRIVERSLALQTLVSQMESRAWGGPLEDRTRADVMRYATYVLHSAVRFMHDEPLPAHTAPPILERNEHDGSIWSPVEHSQEYEDLL